MTPQAQDQLLLERWRENRDPDAFTELVQRHGGMVVATCNRVLKNLAEAEEVAQECFMQLLQRPEAIRVNLCAWLHTLAVSRCKDRIKGEVRRRAREERYADERGAEHTPEIDDILNLVDEAVSRLPEALQMVIVSRFFEGQTHVAVAQQLQVSESTVRNRLDQGVQVLRESLQRRGIPLTVAALTTGLASAEAQAMPSAVQARLSGLALAKTPRGVAVASVAAASSLKPVIVIVALLAAIAFTYISSTSDTPDSPTNARAIPLADPGEAGPPAGEALQPEVARPPGAYTFVVRDPESNGYSSTDEQNPIEIVAGAVLNDVQLRHGDRGGSMIEGVVVNSAGTPVPGATVIAYGKKMIRDEVDDDGHFTLTGLEEGTYSIHAEHREYSLDRGIVASAGDTEMELVLLGKATVSGVVLDGTTGVLIDAFEAGVINGTHRKMRPDLINFGREYHHTDGRFEMEAHAGDITLLVKADGYVPQFLPVATKEHEWHGDFEFRLEPSQAFTGTVKNTRGEVIADAFLYYAGAGYESEYNIMRQPLARTDGAGKFGITSLSPDLVFVGAYHPSYGFGVVDRTEENTIVLPDPGRLVGQVLLDGVPMAGVGLNIVYEDLVYPSRHLNTDDSGAFEISRLTPGAIRVCPLLPSPEFIWEFCQPTAVQAQETVSVVLNIHSGNAALSGQETLPEASVSASINLRVELPDGHSIHRGPLHAGPYHIEGLPPGTAIVEALAYLVSSGEHYVYNEYSIKLSDGIVAELNLDLRQ